LDCRFSARAKSNCFVGRLSDGGNETSCHRFTRIGSRNEAGRAEQRRRNYELDGAKKWKFAGSDYGSGKSARPCYLTKQPREVGGKKVTKNGNIGACMGPPALIVYEILPEGYRAFKDDRRPPRQTRRLGSRRLVVNQGAMQS